MEVGSADHERFDFIELIGEGSYGCVYKALDESNRQNVAIKVMPSDDDTSLRELQLEIDILKEASCPFIVGYIGCFILESQHEYWIVMELCDGGSVLDLIEAESGDEPVRNSPLSEPEMKAILAFTCLGIAYLHSHQSIHRDIKAGNILLTTEGSAKIADFGVSAKINNTLAKRNTVIGSPFWMAPEVIQEELYDGKADIWSLGISAIEMADGNPPLSKIHPMRAIFMIPSKPPPTVQTPSKWSPEFLSFLQHLLVKKAQDRPDIDAVMQHPFIQAEVEALKAKTDPPFTHPNIKALVDRMAPKLAKVRTDKNVAKSTAQRTVKADNESSVNSPNATIKNVRSNSPRAFDNECTLPRPIGARKPSFKETRKQSSLSEDSQNNDQHVQRVDSFQRAGFSPHVAPRIVPLDSKGSLVVQRELNNYGSFQRGPESNMDQTSGVASALKYFQPKNSPSIPPAPVFSGSKELPDIPPSVIITDFQNNSSVGVFDQKQALEQQLQMLEAQYKHDLHQLHAAYLQKTMVLQEELSKLNINF